MQQSRYQATSEPSQYGAHIDAILIPLNIFPSLAAPKGSLLPYACTYQWPCTLVSGSLPMQSPFIKQLAESDGDFLDGLYKSPKRQWTRYGERTLWDNLLMNSQMHQLQEFESPNNHITQAINHTRLPNFKHSRIQTVKTTCPE